MHEVPVEELARLNFLTNQFRPIGLIGEGTFSLVFKAVDLRPNAVHKYVALKRITGTTHPSRVATELEILKKVTGCPNVISLLHVCRESDQVVAVFPFYEHTDFRTFCESCDISEIRSYMRCLLVAIAAIHAKGIVHRDIKPANFLYSTDRKHGVLIDFGLAENERRSKQTLESEHNTSLGIVDALRASQNTSADLSTDTFQKLADSTVANLANELIPTTLPPEININTPYLAETEIKTISTQHKYTFSGTTSVDRDHVLSHVNLESQKEARQNTKFPNLKDKYPRYVSIPVQSNLQATNYSRIGFNPAIKQTDSINSPNPGPPKQITSTNNTETSIDSVLQASRTELARRDITISKITTSRTLPSARKGPVLTKSTPFLRTNIVKNAGPPGYFKHDTRPPMKAPRAGTRGFRAPEVLFKVKSQTTKIDIWASGVIMLILLTKRYPFFASQEDIDAIVEIANIYGTIEMKRIARVFGRVWRSNIESIPAEQKPFETIIKTLNPEATLCPEAIDLLYMLLELDPEKRITAQCALRHPFLQETK